MNTTIFKVLFSVFLIGIIAGCKKSEATSPELLLSNTDYVKYGTSFGECVGYCVHSITITSSMVNFEKKSNFTDTNYPTVTLSEENTSDNWSELMNKIDFNAFTNLEVVIGCPDCADGGAEWIEIKKGKNSYKATFEYGNEPEITKGYIDDLRTIMNSFEK